MPMNVGGGAYVAVRVAAMFWLMLAAVLRVESTPAVERRLVEATVFVVLVQTAVVAHNWRAEQPGIAAFRADLAAVTPKGARILPVTSVDTMATLRHYHLLDHAVTEAEAYSPIFFALPGLQIIRRDPAFAAIGPIHTHENGSADIDWLFLADRDMATLHPSIRKSRWWTADWSCNFDMIAHLREAGPALPEDPRLEKLRSGTFYDFWRIRPRPDCPDRPRPW